MFRYFPLCNVKADAGAGVRGVVQMCHSVSFDKNVKCLRWKTVPCLLYILTFYLDLLPNHDFLLHSLLNSCTGSVAYICSQNPYHDCFINSPVKNSTKWSP